MNYWIAIGSQDQWKTAFEQGNTWGLGARQRHSWNALAEGDIILVYVTKPVSGLVGYGSIAAKFKQDKPLWPQEIAEKKVKWPLRFEFVLNYCLPPDEWSSKRVSTAALKLTVRAGFHRVQPEFGEQMAASVMPAPIPSEAEASTLHDSVKMKLLEIGKLQHFISEKEYVFDIGRLDVVWRRVAASVPTYAFEIQVGGDIYHALAKLKHAFDLWNSRIFLVASEHDTDKAADLLIGTFHEIRDHIKFIELDTVDELYRRKKAYFELEKELGI